jgi:phosphoglycolate phosphatase (TIGR01487 family)
MPTSSVRSEAHDPEISVVRNEPLKGPATVQPDVTPPLVLDIDGTLTTPEGPVDPRIFHTLAEWDAPVVLATGKAFPYPVALCHFVGIPETVIAENGGVVYADDEVTFNGDPARAEAVLEEFLARGGETGWGAADTVNRWRATERAVSQDADEALLREIAADHGVEVVDTGYAFHVKTPGVEKGEGLRAVAGTLDRDPREFVAIGDSENDASTFAVAGRSFAVANADDVAKAAADEVTDRGYFDGTIGVLESLA